MIAFAGFSKGTADGDKISFEDLASVGLRITGYEANHDGRFVSLFIRISRDKIQSILFKNSPGHFIDDVIDERISRDVLRLIIAAVTLDSDLDET